jgi:two-component system, chemotaxis family, chemotaxis protein CheY
VSNSMESEVSVCMAPNGSPKLCLIVDDSPTIRKVARRLVAGFGFEIDDAENGQIALEKCRDRAPDVILLDWNMPVMNGLEFLQKLRGAENGKAPRVIFCTTESDVDHIRQAIEAGADEYLMKPFDKVSLTAKLNAVTRAR